jgi:hypothetical protein
VGLPSLSERLSERFNNGLGKSAKRRRDVISSISVVSALSSVR